MIAPYDTSGNFGPSPWIQVTTPLDSDQISDSRKKQKMTPQADLDCNLDIFCSENDVAVSEPRDREKIMCLSALLIAIWHNNMPQCQALMPKCKPLLNTVAHYDGIFTPVSAHSPNAQPHTPLLNASQNIPIAELLIENGADVNLGIQTKSGYLTPLLQALLDKNLPMIKVLAKNHVDVHRLTPKGHSYLIEAITGDASRAIINKLVTMGLNLQLSQELIARGELAQIWGITGTSNFIDEIGRHQTFQLGCGLTTKQAHKLICQYVQKFFQSNVLNPIEKKWMKFIKEAFILKETPNQIVEKIKNNIPCVILGGYCGHTIVMTIHQGYLAISDRIARNLSKKCTTDFYKLPVERCTEAFIKGLQFLYDNQNAFQSMVTNLKISPLPNNKNFMQKFLNSPNCAWANSKAAVHTLFIMTLGKQAGRSLYKKFSQFTRTNSLETYINHRNIPEHPLAQRDANLLAKIRTKQEYRAQRFIY